VEAERTLGREAAGEVDGIATLDRHLLALPLAQAHDPSFEHVDRRNRFELAC
jgi:hypothetical protein